IGTMSPLSKLSVAQTAETGVIEFRLGTNGADARNAILRKDTTTPWLFDIIGAAHPTVNAGAIRFFTSDQASGEKVRITAAGDVGIGTASPGIILTAKLTVRGGNLFEDSYLLQEWVSSVSNARIAYLGQSAFNDGIFSLRSRTGSADVVLSAYSANWFMLPVGIGTNTPQGVLDVVSTTGALIVPRMSTAQRDGFAAVNGMIIYNTTTNEFNFRENGAWITKN
ncbi:hypothetical protein ACFL5X_04310, partial [Candidatus Omnitrophota bacterium]